MLLPPASISWLYLFVNGVEKRSGAKIFFSFIFLSLAINSHLSGVILIPVGIVLWMIYRPKIASAWLWAGLALFLLPYSLFLVDAWKHDWTPIASIYHGIMNLASGRGYGREEISVVGCLLSFLKHSIRFLGIPFGLFSVIALIVGAKDIVFYAGKRKSFDAISEWLPWISIQATAGLALLLANNRPWYFLIYCLGSFGSIAIVMKKLLSRGGVYSKAVILYMLILLFLIFPGTNSLKNRNSYFPLYFQIRELVSSGKLAPTDISRVHAIPHEETNMGANMEWFTAISSTFSEISSAEPADVENNVHYLFNFYRKQDNELTGLLRELFPEQQKNKYYSAYTSRIDRRSCRICDAPLDDLAELPQGDYPGCIRTECGWKSDYHLYLELGAYYYYPELTALRNTKSAPHIEHGVKYTFIADMTPADKVVKKRLIVIQTDGNPGLRLLHNMHYYSAAGTYTKMAGGRDIIIYTWFIIPAEPGSIAFEWQRKPCDNTRFRKDDPFLDIIDIDIPF